MFSFLQRPRQAMDAGEVLEPGAKVLSFDAAAIVRAISYHLLDEHKVNVINPESAKSAVKKLSERIHVLAIAADQWAVMASVERLQWLLSHSRITLKGTSSGTAVLSVRR